MDHQTFGQTLVSNLVCFKAFFHRFYNFTVPGVSQFVPFETPNDSPAVIKGLTEDDLSTIHQLGNLPTHHLLEEVKRLQNIAYQLGLEETKEMTRGKYLNILRKRR